MPWRLSQSCILSEPSPYKYEELRALFEFISISLISETAERHHDKAYIGDHSSQIYTIHHQLYTPRQIVEAMIDRSRTSPAYQRPLSIARSSLPLSNFFK